MNFKKSVHYFLISTLLIPSLSISQENPEKKLSFNADFRFRIEEDWNSKKPDGSLRDNRTRLRYRLRAGFDYQLNDWSSFGARLRTGFPNKQQDPQLTLGDGFGEFNTLPIGFEKVYFEAEQKGYVFWLGKNTFPFFKQHELFWSDNVYPEGIFFRKKFAFNSNTVDKLDLNGGHFIVRASGTSLDKDSYFQGLQASASLMDGIIKCFSSLYLFRNMPDIPDGAETFVFDYSIFNVGTTLLLSKKQNINFEIDYYNNLEDYSNNNNIEAPFKDQKSGFVTAIGFGKFKEKSDWKFKATYTYLERYAAVDFLAQNDWARWDYSSFESPDGRLTNLRGIELVASYLLQKNMKLTLKYYKVKQLIPFGVVKETGDRVRLDLDVSF
ncbi:putative porin [Tamlana sp. 2201CG12-4]|uniref:putative porin n=1 Tax=Tamlana sp. 2201CG12-4 TaxID=3112582 RepID=UPI002DBD4AD8|nr:putative porin [Tamlana sp. 2201CG12-4]MEC3908164.1 putative porin [Tamlana sp. 2201CG12-4]